MRGGPYADRESGSGRYRWRTLRLVEDVCGDDVGDIFKERNMAAKRATRVKNQTSPQVNTDIRRRTEMRIAYYEKHPEQIGERLAELNREWNIERVLRTASSSLTLFGIAMAVLRRSRWLLVPLGVQGFVLQQTIQTERLPLPFLRRL